MKDTEPVQPPVGAPALAATKGERTRRVLRLARKRAIAVLGSSVVVGGVALIVLPGLAIVASGATW